MRFKRTAKRRREIDEQIDSQRFRQTVREAKSPHINESRANHIKSMSNKYEVDCRRTHTRESLEMGNSSNYVCVPRVKFLEMIREVNRNLGDGIKSLQHQIDTLLSIYGATESLLTILIEDSKECQSKKRAS